MPNSVARQKSHALAFESTKDKLIRRTSERSLDFDLIDLCEFRHLIEAAAANDAYFRCSHTSDVECLRQAIYVGVFNQNPINHVPRKSDAGYASACRNGDSHQRNER